MEQLILMMAKFMPEEDLLNDLEKALARHKAEKTKEAKDNLRMHLTLLTTKWATEKEDISETLEKFKRMSKLHDHFQTSKS